MGKFRGLRFESMQQLEDGRAEWLSHLMPLYQLLGLDHHVISDPQQIRTAYKQRLRADPSQADALRVAVSVLIGGEEAQTNFVREQQQQKIQAPLSLVRARPCRGSQVRGGAEAPSASGRNAFGWASVQGRRPRMEDEVLLGSPLGSGRVHAFGVFDGHGGPQAARMLSRHLPSALQRAVTQNVHDSGGHVIPEAAAIAAFEEVERRILERSGADGWDDGSTALVACVDGANMTLFQVGDCNAILCSRSGVLCTGGPLCTAHRPPEPSEAERLRLVGVEPSATGRVCGLAVSRAFGNLSIKSRPPGYLTVQPEVVTRVITAEDERQGLLVLASDGLWDHLTPEEACKILAAGSHDCALDDVGFDLHHAALCLVDAALENGSEDNISVVLVRM